MPGRTPERTPRRTPAPGRIPRTPGRTGWGLGFLGKRIFRFDILKHNKYFIWQPNNN